jgi:hypothetical protein
MIQQGYLELNLEKIERESMMGLDPIWNEFCKYFCADGA